uniref:NADH-ubiquinone oxidoreductase chain 4L n=1 Tax=Tettigarcta crinita TaxID=295286 RepID=A0A3S7MEN0_9HEMI|nr:NADH dehydrogenase subunit 4L [Tettigarcta crinita]
MKMFFIIYINMYLCGLISLCLIRDHVMLTLLSLEFIILSLFLILSLYINNFDYELYILIIFLTFSVCEGVLGLSILVSMIRSHGNDFLKSINLITC